MQLRFDHYKKAQCNIKAVQYLIQTIVSNSNISFGSRNKRVDDYLLNLKTGFTFLCMRRRHKAEAERYALRGGRLVF